MTAAIPHAISEAGPAMVTAAKAPKSQPEPRSVPVDTQRSPKRPTSRRRPSESSLTAPTSLGTSDLRVLGLGQG